jgi:uncharacterized Fe-S center protein
MLASFDPVALDQACADLCNAMPVVAESVLGEEVHAHPEEAKEHDHFHMIHPDTEWESCLSHAEKIGLGSREYKLVKI